MAAEEGFELAHDERGDAALGLVGVEGLGAQVGEVTSDERVEERGLGASVYFEALAKVAGVSGGVISHHTFAAWEAGQKFTNTFMFSKRVARWLALDHPDVAYVKPAVMREAARLVEVNDIEARSLKELLDKVRGRMLEPRSRT